jgi:hypothetical protein
MALKDHYEVYVIVPNRISGASISFYLHFIPETQQTTIAVHTVLMVLAGVQDLL